MSAPLTWIGRC